MISGLAVVDKPAGMTSHDVVGRCRRIFGQRRVGHAGTLDPDATGVLLVGLGQATRLLQYLTGLPKSYECRIVLGRATSTLDASGETTGEWDMTHVTLADARGAAAALTGDIEQIPPMVSAIKIGGKRLHELAREGIEVERPPRRVHIARFDVDLAEPPTPANQLTRAMGETGGPPPTATPEKQAPGALGPVFAAHVTCSSGTYVRSLAADLGAALGGGAHLRDLVRTSVGPWDLSEAVPLDELEPTHVQPPAAAVRMLEPVTVPPERIDAIAHGRVLAQSELGAAGGGPWAVLAPSGELLAVYANHGEGRAKPTVVLAG
ncbi:tRNA pseudouridine(55) synthase TruB [Acidiferrimicrobium sp. IK]|uniref:tRNA pseudouridine(55) synthase TruB n=1 Tax=Acidiferrimicrobium sp. IK TaxID=2871700 RepID=UPI0021CB3BB4|nr:tRNA pseudouridine(55) synthase TruB [Acidiferrimicrobium sp. IK]MCU4183742.1 tRNA pseudouridine(55) synthase TruB [Acidiferrimicrobium sp. IK]